VIPVYNEIHTLPALLPRVLQAPLEGRDREIILVDDGSQDGTRSYLETIKDPQVRVFFHDHNCGKGSALRTGFTAATGEVIIVQDADLEYAPEEYPRLLAPILEGHTQVVYGSRFKGRDRHVHASSLFYFGGQIVTWIANLLYGLRLTDEPTCYKVFRRSLLQNLDLQCHRFEFCPEFTAKVARSGIPILEVPISYHPRTVREGKKIGWRDGVQAISTLFRYRFRK
jgi:glycosyltransferase involved in cell wall biosynthesis